MELKVWCDGIPRVVCGASATTTCQDVVFALAHATGQVGRFILIEKWRHCERVLAPGDRPLASLLKFGEYAADVTFVMKKSGEVSTTSNSNSNSNANSNSATNNGGKVINGSSGGNRTTLLLNSSAGGKKSDSELLQANSQNQRKVLANSDQNVPPQPTLQSAMSNSKSAGALSSSAAAVAGSGGQSAAIYQYHSSATLPHRGHRPEPFVRSISFHKPAELQLANSGEVLSSSHLPHHHQHTLSMSNNNSSNSGRSGVNYVPVNRTAANHQQELHHHSAAAAAKHEPIYSSTKASSNSSSSRPPKPPPYFEAIVKSSLFNGSSSNSSSNANSNGIYGYIGGTSTSAKQLTSSQQQNQQTNGHLAYQHLQNQNKNQQQPSPLQEHQRLNMMLNNGGNGTSSQPNHLTKSHLSYLQQETRSIIDAQQQTIKKQEKDMVTIDQELSAVQRRLTANERAVAQYRAEMDYLYEIWLDQEALLGRLEGEHLEEELERLISEAKAYEDELAEVRRRLTSCETDIARSREQISSLLVQVDEATRAKELEIKKAEEKNEGEQARLYASLQNSITEKTKEIESQKLDLSLLCASLERLDKTIQEKNGIIDQLVVEIKDANVEGLSLSGGRKSASAGDGLTVRNLDEGNSQNQNQRSNNSQQNNNHHQGVQNPLINSSSSSTRKISVLPSELGNTVPTKKNPDGIWV